MITTNQKLMRRRCHAFLVPGSITYSAPRSKERGIIEKKEHGGGVLSIVRMTHIGQYYRTFQTDDACSEKGHIQVVKSCDD